MNRTSPRRQVYLALPTPQGSTRIHRIEMKDVVTGRDVRIDVAPRASNHGHQSSLGRAVRWLRRLAFLSTE